MIDKKELKKNEWYIIDNGLGPIRAKLMESPRQGKGWKHAVLMDVKASAVGFFDEMGTVYIENIIHHLKQKFND